MSGLPNELWNLWTYPPLGANPIGARLLYLRTLLDAIEMIKSGVTTVYNNDSEGELGLGKGKDYCYYESNEGRVIPVAAVKGRYVRFHSKGNSAGPSNDYIEAEVWGVPAK